MKTTTTRRAMRSSSTARCMLLLWASTLDASIPVHLNFFHLHLLAFHMEYEVHIETMEKLFLKHSTLQEKEVIRLMFPITIITMIIVVIRPYVLSSDSAGYQSPFVLIKCCRSPQKMTPLLVPRNISLNSFLIRWLISQQVTWKYSINKRTSLMASSINRGKCNLVSRFL